MCHFFSELWTLSGTDPYGRYKSSCGVTFHELRHRIHPCHPPNLLDKPANFPITFAAICYQRTSQLLKGEQAGRKGPVHANYLIKPGKCLPCLLLHWFSVVSLERAVTPVLLASQGLHRISHALCIPPPHLPTRNHGALHLRGRRRVAVLHHSTVVGIIPLFVYPQSLLLLLCR